MTWLIVAMGVLLILVGAISVISGAPIIQIERGWAEVIAGAVAVSGGAVTFAIGVLMFRLQMWQHAATMRGVAVPAASLPPIPLAQPPIADQESVGTDFRPTRAPDEPVHVASAPDEAERAAVEEPAPHPNLWKSVPEAPPMPFRPVENPMMAAAARLASASDEEAAVVGGAPAAEPVGSDHPAPSFENGLRPRRLLFPPSDRSEGPDLGPRSSTLSRDWMSRPLLRPRAPQAPAAQEPPPLFAGPSADLEEDRAPAVQPMHRVGDDDRSAAPPLESEPPPPELRSGSDVGVVGRYQAGSSTYTMYSNGSIDVETQGGDTHHFTSMDDLKAFIARQDSAVS